MFGLHGSLFSPFLLSAMALSPGRITTLLRCQMSHQTTEREQMASDGKHKIYTNSSRRIRVTGDGFIGSEQYNPWDDRNRSSFVHHAPSCVLRVLRMGRPGMGRRKCRNVYCIVNAIMVSRFLTAPPQGEHLALSKHCRTTKEVALLNCMPVASTFRLLSDCA